VEASSAGVLVAWRRRENLPCRAAATRQDEDDYSEGLGEKGANTKDVVAAAKKASAEANMATASDPGAPARCKQVNTASGTAPGKLDCKPWQDQFGLAKWTTGKGAKAKCVAAWGGKVSCPDGITSQGVFLTKFCAKWQSDLVALGLMETSGSQASGGVLVATKALAKHVHKMSQNSGVLLMKRAVCKNNKCSVFKSGLCIDVGKKVWSSPMNHNIKDPKGEAMKFATEAEKLLVQYKNVLPEKHLCSDKRHKKDKKCPSWACKDAKIGKNAVLLF